VSGGCRQKQDQTIERAFRRLDRHVAGGNCPYHYYIRAKSLYIRAKRVTHRRELPLGAGQPKASRREVAVMRVLSCFVLLSLLGAVPSLAQPRDSRVHKLAELAWPQIDALDRERTMFILPIGMIEEHGPHLPVASDTFGVEYEAAGVSKRVSAALPQWRVVMMPTIHYGSINPDFNGLAVYHVLQGSSMGQNPPIMKLAGRWESQSMRTRTDRLPDHPGLPMDIGRSLVRGRDGNA
jgi:hypothetical protein